MNARNIRRGIFLTAVGMLLMGGSCNTPTPFTAENIDYSSPQAPATILIGDPQVFSRETLINDRRIEQEYLESLLDESKDVKFEPQLLRELSSISALSSSLGLSFNPAQGAAADRTAEIESLRADLEVKRLETELARREKLLEGVQNAEPPKVKLTADISNTPGASGTVPTSPDMAAIRKDVTDLRSRLDDLAKSGLKLSDRRAAALRVAGAKASPRENFLEREAYRADLRSALNAVRLDDRHDDAGNALYRLQFDATVLPGGKVKRGNSKQWGAAQFEIAAPEWDKDSLDELYHSWLGYLASRLNFRSDGGAGTQPRTDANLYALAAATGMVEIFLLPFDLDHQFGKVDYCSGLTLESAVKKKCGVLLLPLPVESDANMRYLLDEWALCRYVRNKLGRDLVKATKLKAIRKKLPKTPNANLDFEAVSQALLKKPDAYLDTDMCTDPRMKREQKLRVITPLVNSSSEDLNLQKNLDPNLKEKKKIDDFEATILRMDKPFSIAIKGAGFGLRYSEAPPDDGIRSALAELLILIERAKANDAKQPKLEEYFSVKDPGCSHGDLWKREHWDDLFACVVTGEISSQENNSANQFHQPLPVIYDVAPIELAHRRSTIASQANSFETALALAAALPGSGMGANAGIGYLRTVAGNVEAMERVPLVIGFSDKAESIGKFGWLFGPRMKVNVKLGKIELEHRPARYDVFADIAVPSWWPYIELEVRTAWIRDWKNWTEDRDAFFHYPKAGKYCAAAKCDRSLIPRKMRVPLPVNNEGLYGLTEFILRVRGRTLPNLPNIERILPRVITTCVPQTTLAIEGANLWRAREVFVNGILATNLRVLPDMRGINATVSGSDLAKLSALREGSKEDKPVKVNITVTTRDGLATRPIQVLIGKNCNT